MFGPYRLLDRVGQGGMAEVFLAEPIEAGPLDRVAVKRILPHYAAHRHFVRMLQDEARIAAAIEHPNVCRVVDVGFVEKIHYIAMEFVDGVDLGAVLRTLGRSQGRVPLAAALFIARCVAEGLEAAHGLTDETGAPLGVIHRDVSPHNILVSYAGEVKLIDFGVAKASTNMTQTRSGVIKGKLRYMSPEQAQAKEIDARADVFSLGLTLYKMLTGRLPFRGSNEFQVYQQILTKRPTPPSFINAEVTPVTDAVVMKALRKSPEKRFQSAGEMAHLLARALREEAAGYGPADLATFLESAAPRRSLVPRTEENDDDFMAAEVGAEVNEPATSAAGMSDAAIDRLTRVGSQPSHSGVDSRPVPPVVGPARLGSRDRSATAAQSVVTDVDAPAGPDDSEELEDATVRIEPSEVAGSLFGAEGGAPDRPSASSAEPPVSNSAGSGGVSPPAQRQATVSGAPPARVPLAVRADDGFLEDAHAEATHAIDISAPALLESHAPVASAPEGEARGPRAIWLLVGILFAAALGFGTTRLMMPSADDAPPPPRLTVAEPPRVAVTGAPNGAVAAVAVADADGAVPADAGSERQSLDAAVQRAALDASGGAAAVAAGPASRTLAPPVPVVKDQPARQRRPRRAAKTRAQQPKGYVTVNSLPWSWVDIDGRPTGKHTPLVKRSVPAGARTVRLRTEDGRTVTKRVTVEAGRTVTVTHTF
ncbi:MAG: protein kinase domain-containing protein [Planctomycetota bacterium]